MENVLKLPNQKFTPTQVADLAKSGLSPEAASKLGYINVTDPNIAGRLLKKDIPVPVPALGIPCYPKGNSKEEPLSWRLKPDNPRVDQKSGKLVKYENPVKTPLHIYIPPAIDSDNLYNSSTKLIITEGEKKAACAVQNGFLCVGGLGVSGFHDKKLSDKKANKFTLRLGLLEIPLRDRDVYIAFDALKFKKLGVLHAEIRLARMLVDRGANVHLVHLPVDKSSTKDLGLDDLLQGPSGKATLEKLMLEAWQYPIFKEINQLPTRVLDDTKNKSYLDGMTAYLAFEPEADREPYVKMLKTKLGQSINNVRGKIADYEEEFRKKQLTGTKDQGAIKKHLEDLRNLKVKTNMRKDLQISQVIIEDMGNRGSFLRDSKDNRAYYFNKETLTVSPIEVGEQLQIELNTRYGVNASEHEFYFLMNEIEVHAKTQGLLTTVHTMSFFDEATGKLYFSNRPDQVFRVTKDEITETRNGDEGVYFEDFKSYEPFTRIEDFDKDQMKEMFGIFNYSDNGLTGDDAYHLIKLFMTYLLFKKQRRPIPHIQGDFGSGKSVFSRIIGKLLMGQGFDVTLDLKKRDDLIAALCGSFLLAWDNIEDMPDDLINVLCTASTGGKEKRRKLYADNIMLEYFLSCAVITNSRTSYFQHGRPDLTDRMLLIGLERCPEKVEEEIIYQELNTRRDHFWSQLLVECQEYLRNLDQNKTKRYQTKARMADFWIFLLRITNGSPQVQKLIANTIENQAKTSLESNSWYVALLIVLEKNGGKLAEETASGLLARIKPIVQDELNGEITFNAISFGKYLKDQLDNLKQLLVVEAKQVSGTWHYWFSLKYKANSAKETSKDPVFSWTEGGVAGGFMTKRLKGLNPGIEDLSKPGGLEPAKVLENLEITENSLKIDIQDGGHWGYGGLNHKLVEKNKINEKNNFIFNKGFSLTYPITPTPVGGAAENSLKDSICDRYGEPISVNPRSRHQIPKDLTIYHRDDLIREYPGDWSDDPYWHLSLSLQSS